jgi:hypothetical protein
MRRSLTEIFHDLLQTFAQPFDSYRPELHYMRGPGPKWHAKRGGSAAASAAPVAEAVLRQIAEVRA